MKMDRDQLIRERAYAIWEREGRPNGRADAHWFQAVRELQAECRCADRLPDRAGHGSEQRTAEPNSVAVVELARP